MIFRWSTALQRTTYLSFFSKKPRSCWNLIFRTFLKMIQCRIIHTSLLQGESHLNHHSSSKMLDVNTQMCTFKPRGTNLNNNYCSIIPRFTFFNVYEQISLVLHVWCTVQEGGKQHRIITRNALIIIFHNKSWAAVGCQMTFR